MNQNKLYCNKGPCKQVKAYFSLLFFFVVMNIVNFEKNYRGPIAELEDKCYVAVAKAERLMHLLNDLGKELSLWVVNIYFI